MKRLILSALTLLFCAIGAVQAKPNSQEKIYDMVYKELDTLSFRMRIRVPANVDASAKLPVLVTLAGASVWKEGSVGITAKDMYSRYFANRGIVTAAIETRENIIVHSLDAIPKDAKSAVRYIIANADKYNIDTEKIILLGGSRGGYAAAAVAICPAINESSDDLSIDVNPAALILLNPVLANGPDREGAYKGWGHNTVADRYREVSPIYNIREGIPPMLYISGDKDRLIPVEQIEEVKRLVSEVGGRCDVKIYEGREHAFFNIKGRNAKEFYLTAKDMDEFLVSLGMIDKGENLDEWIATQLDGKLIYK